MAKQYRVFNGKRYSLHGDDNSRGNALKRAEKLRKGGAKVRVVKSGDYYRIYVRS